MTVINRKVTFLCSGYEVFQKVDCESIVGRQVKVTFNRQKIVTLPFRSEFGPKRSSRYTYSWRLIYIHLDFVSYTYYYIRNGLNCIQ